jgi:hypothetical protein
LDCATIRHDSALVLKYGKILNQTLFYRNYRGQNLPKAVSMQTSLSTDLSIILSSILEENRDNREIFEYLMAYYLLERDFERANVCYDRYFHNFSYPRIPVHYAEFLTLYQHINNLDKSFYLQYPVPKEIRESYEKMNKLLSSKMNRITKKQLEDGFKNTYWFYFGENSIKAE